MMRPPSLQCNFFSSLKQVEKRLKLESQSDSGESSSTSSSQVPETNPPTPTQPLGSPLYLHLTHPANTNTNTTNNTLQDSSEAPEAFLSSSPQLLPTHPTQAQINPPGPPVLPNEIDDIEYLMQLLGLSDIEEETQKRKKKKGIICGGNSCGCECGFYEKIVGVKGPKCEKEMERMEGWIRYFLKNGIEPLRLAYLLMGKAAFENDNEYGFETLEFPSVIDEFLKTDPPRD